MRGGSPNLGTGPDQECRWLAGPGAHVVQMTAALLLAEVELSLVCQTGAAGSDDPVGQVKALHLGRKPAKRNTPHRLHPHSDQSSSPI